MNYCPSCYRPLPDGRRVCRRCEAPYDPPGIGLTVVLAIVGACILSTGILRLDARLAGGGAIVVIVAILLNVFLRTLP